MYDSPCEIFETGILKRSAKVLIHPDVKKRKNIMKYICNIISLFVLIPLEYKRYIYEEKWKVKLHDGN